MIESLVLLFFGSALAGLGVGAGLFTCWWMATGITPHELAAWIREDWPAPRRLR